MPSSHNALSALPETPDQRSKHTTGSAGHTLRDHADENKHSTKISLNHFEVSKCTSTDIASIQFLQEHRGFTPHLPFRHGIFSQTSDETYEQKLFQSTVLKQPIWSGNGRSETRQQSNYISMWRRRRTARLFILAPIEETLKRQLILKTTRLNGGINHIDIPNTDMITIRKHVPARRRGLATPPTRNGKLR